MLFWQIVPDVPRSVIRRQILSLRIQRALNHSAHNRLPSAAAPLSQAARDQVQSQAGLAAVISGADDFDEDPDFIPTRAPGTRATSSNVRPFSPPPKVKEEALRAKASPSRRRSST